MKVLKTGQVHFLFIIENTYSRDSRVIFSFIIETFKVTRQSIQFLQFITHCKNTHFHKIASFIQLLKLVLAL